MEEKIVLGVDIGGSHITATLVDLNNGRVLEGTGIRNFVDANANSKEIISLWADVIRKAFKKYPVIEKKIGIAMPGPFDYSAGIAWMQNQDKYDSLYGLNVKELLADKLHIPSLDIRFINDAESFLKGETYSGAAKDAASAIGLTLGTGFGSARYCNGKVEDADLWCSPFLDGIAEDYLSTRWFVAQYKTLTGKAVLGVKELAALVDQDLNAAGTFREFGFNLALFLRHIIIKENPETIVIGGNISKAFHLFYKELDMHLETLNSKPTIYKTILEEEASLVGAASCWAGVGEQVLETIRA